MCDGVDGNYNEVCCSFPGVLCWNCYCLLVFYYLNRLGIYILSGDLVYL